MMGPTLQFRQDNVIAITGADMSPLLNEEPVPMNSAIAVHSGDVLRLQTAKDGCRAYIAFAGGLDVPEVMGSGYRCAEQSGRQGWLEAPGR